MQLAPVRENGWAIHHITNPSEKVQLAFQQEKVFKSFLFTIINNYGTINIV